MFSYLNKVVLISNVLIIELRLFTQPSNIKLFKSDSKDFYKKFYQNKLCSFQLFIHLKRRKKYQGFHKYIKLFST